MHTGRAAGRRCTESAGDLLDHCVAAVAGPGTACISPRTPAASSTKSWDAEFRSRIVIEWYNTRENIRGNAGRAEPPDAPPATTIRFTFWCRSLGPPLLAAFLYLYTVFFVVVIFVFFFLFFLFSPPTMHLEPLRLGDASTLSVRPVVFSVPSHRRPVYSGNARRAAERKRKWTRDRLAYELITERSQSTARYVRADTCFLFLTFF